MTDTPASPAQEPSAPPPLLGPVAHGLDTRAMAIAVYALYLGAFVTGGLSALAGVIIVYLVRKDASEALESHMIFQLRTFWIGLAASAVGVLLIPAFGFGFLVLLGVGLWFMIRGVAGLSQLLSHKPYPTPRGWFI